jgi:hypothetical protein
LPQDVRRKTPLARRLMRRKHSPSWLERDQTA